MKRIAIEEHFTTEEHLDCLRSISENEYPRREDIEEDKYISIKRQWFQKLPPSGLNRRADTTTSRLLDLGEGRLRQMAEDGIDMQVLSLIHPGVQVFEASTGTTLAREINDKLSKVIREYPNKFSGLATLAPQDPTEAANELERTVLELGFKGANINSHTKGEYLDDRKYWVIFERAEKLGVPIYIHPTALSEAMIEPYVGYPVLSGAMHGFATEVSIAALRLICSGVFDEYSKLKIILGHLGEALPYWLWRMDNHWQRDPLANKLKKTPSEYIRDNFLITTSGMFWQPSLMCAYLALGADRILFAVDYPLESNKEAVQFMEAAPICDNDKEKICHLNAERLFMI